MPILSIGDLEIDGIALGICKRPRNVTALGQVRSGFRVMVDGEPAQALVVAEKGVLLATDEEDVQLPWSTLAWDGSQLSSPELPRSPVGIHLSDVSSLTTAIAEAGGGVDPQAAVVEHPADAPRTGTCPDCGQLVSLRATTCVHCGAPLSAQTTAEPDHDKKWRQKMLSNSNDQTRYLRSFWLVLMIFLVVNLAVAMAVLATSSG